MYFIGCKFKFLQEFRRLRMVLTWSWRRYLDRVAPLQLHQLQCGDAGPVLSAGRIASPATHSGELPQPHQSLTQESCPGPTSRSLRRAAPAPPVTTQENCPGLSSHSLRRIATVPPVAHSGELPGPSSHSLRRIATVPPVAHSGELPGPLRSLTQKNCPGLTGRSLRRAAPAPPVTTQENCHSPTGRSLRRGARAPPVAHSGELPRPLRSLTQENCPGLTGLSLRRAAPAPPVTTQENCHSPTGRSLRRGARAPPVAHSGELPRPLRSLTQENCHSPTGRSLRRAAPAPPVAHSGEVPGPHRSLTQESCPGPSGHSGELPQSHPSRSLTRAALVMHCFLTALNPLSRASSHLQSYWKRHHFKWILHPTGSGYLDGILWGSSFLAHLEIFEIQNITTN
ncbi:rho GTPase-activating protein 17-like [Pan troglodytes]|uniref:rho GTPase-activating protein 17-like n=1 Tax=Pan troglodytes TaxID=9598 RepID=UPI003013CDC4